MEFRAEARYMRVSPQKARLVLNLIRGRRVEEARNTLAFTKKRVAATRFLVKASVLRASSTRRPRIRFSTSRAFCGDTRINLAFA